MPSITTNATTNTGWFNFTGSTAYYSDPQWHWDRQSDEHYLINYSSDSTATTCQLPYECNTNGWIVTRGGTSCSCDINQTLTLDYVHNQFCVRYPQDPKSLLKEIIKKRHAPFVHTPSRTNAVGHPVDEREARARETLRLIVGDVTYFRFLKNGFITVKNPVSGYSYQIFYKSHSLVNVFQDGKEIARLCIYLKGNFPATDFIVTLALMAINNDNRIWEIANRNPPRTHTQRNLPVLNNNRQSLVEIFQNMKKTG